MALLRRLLTARVDDGPAPACSAHASRELLDMAMRQAHKLVGSAGTLGASRIRALAAEAEGAARNGDASAAAALSRELQLAMSALRTSVEVVLPQPMAVAVDDAPSVSGGALDLKGLVHPL